MKTISIISLVIVVGAGVARAQQQCRGLTVRECMKLEPGYGITDDNCYRKFPESVAAKLRQIQPGYSIQDCLYANVQLREIVRGRLEGTIPDSRDSTCIDDHGARVCVAVPSDKDLDQASDTPPVQPSGPFPPNPLIDRHLVQDMASAQAAISTHPELMTLPGATNVSIGYDDHNHVAIVITTSKPIEAQAEAPGMVGVVPVVIEPLVN